MEGRQIDMETNKKQQYLILYQEKKINAEENRMKVDCVHFISKKIVLRSVVNQRKVRRKMKIEANKVCLKKTCIVLKCF